MLALVATVAVVALLATVVAMLRPGGQGSHRTAISTSTATPRPIVALPLRATYAGQPGIPVVAASNPNVIYEYNTGAGSSALKQSPTLRRSDDGGASWHTLAFPTAPGTFVAALSLAVNPADAANVFLNVTLDYRPGAPGACDQANPGDTSVLCANEYVSTDSGEHWTLMRYPVPGTLFPNPIPNGTYLSYDPDIVQAQGGMLYGTLQDHNTQRRAASAIRIISSTDEGKTWHVADATIAAAGLHICDFVAAPSGTTLFARTAAVCQGPNFTQRQLWRSDDAGAHWRQVTPFGAPFNTIFNSFTVAAATGDGGSHLIIYDGTQNQQTNVVTYYASLDGGMTWQPAPAAGLPDGAQAVFLPQQMDGGSLVVPFITSTSGGTAASSHSGPTPTPSPTPTSGQAADHMVACYAWKPGQARWLPLTQPVVITGLLPPMNVYISDGAQRVVTLTLIDNAGMRYTIKRFA